MEQWYRERCKKGIIIIFNLDMLQIIIEYIGDITRLQEVNICGFYFPMARTSERSERVRYEKRVSCHENMKSISLSHRVMFYSLCAHFECR